MALTTAEHEPDQAKSNTTAGLWSEDSAGRNLGPSAQQELLQVSRLRNQDHAGGAFVASQNPRAASHYNQRQVARRVSKYITVHLFQSLMPLLILSEK